MGEQWASKDIFPTAISRKNIACIAFGVSPLVDAFAITFDVTLHKKEGGGASVQYGNLLATCKWE